jgi:hypothetical protein
VPTTAKDKLPRSVAEGSWKLPGPVAAVRQAEQNRACALATSISPKVSEHNGEAAHKKSRSFARAGYLNLVKSPPQRSRAATGWVTARRDGSVDIYEATAGAYVKESLASRGFKKPL